MLNMASVSTVSDLMLLGHFQAVCNVLSPFVHRERIWGGGVKSPLIHGTE